MFKVNFFIRRESPRRINFFLLVENRPRQIKKIYLSGIAPERIKNNIRRKSSLTNKKIFIHRDFRQITTTTNKCVEMTVHLRIVQPGCG